MYNKAIDYLILASLADTDEETLAYFNQAKESEDYDKAVKLLDNMQEQKEEEKPEEESEDVTDYKAKKMME